MKKTIGILLFGIACGLLASGLILLVSSQPRGVPITLLPQPTASPLYVHVTGEVKAPGVYEVSNGAHVQDAIQLAGGFLPDADPNALNLAERIIDGQKIVVPRAGQEPLPLPDHAAPEKAQPVWTGPLRINTATQTELESLPGIGPAKAAAIIEHRTTHGPFQSLEDLQQVPGIGEKICEQIKDLIILP